RAVEDTAQEHLQLRSEESEILSRRERFIVEIFRFGFEGVSLENGRRERNFHTICKKMQIVFFF
ncbi:MAG: hypothetical protein NC416_15020, partial [Eubacterium sp.]|nr:hypothetical protein [Eubacterium sp.]